VLERTGDHQRELRLLHAAGGLVVFVSVTGQPEMTLPAAHDLASQLEEDIRDGGGTSRTWSCSPSRR
jgi:divalent metal cation (Fe/Co/Zn/Cd) transporter